MASISRRLGRPRRGIRSLLLLLLLPTIVVVLALDSMSDYRTLTDTANTAYDSSLLASARMLSSGLLLDESGKLQAESSLHAQFLDRTQARLRRHFRIDEIEPVGAGVLSKRERILAGTADLPHPPSWPTGEEGGVFFDAVYHGVPVHAVAVLRVIQRGAVSREALVVVAENADWRSGVELRARGQEAWRDLAMLLLGSLLLWLCVHWALHPLRRLSGEVMARSPDDLTPLDDRGVPDEVVPLVQAINLHLGRHQQMLAERAQFLADASHQLRTPLAILSTQAQYALREADPSRAREALQAIVEQLGRSRRLIEQLLSLAHASQADPAQREIVDLVRICRDAVMQHLPLAREKNQDLGWLDARANAGAGSAPVIAGEVELREILANLIHNAIHYSPAGARITVALAQARDRYEVAVVDSGPGIPEHERERVFQRFERAGHLGAPHGSGLGLSIARAYARRNRGGIDLRDGEANAMGGRGLSAVLWLPGSPEIHIGCKTGNCQKNDSIA